MLTNIEINSDDTILVKNLKKTLQKKFSLTSYKDIDKAVILTNYLFSFGKIDECKNLLDSFVFKLEYSEEKEDLWGSIGQGIILRAYIGGIEKDYSLKEKALKNILENDIMTDRVGCYDLYQECVDDHMDNMRRAEDETQKYKCEIYGQEALTFLYFYEILPYKDKKIFDDVSGDILNFINKSYKYLKESLN